MKTILRLSALIAALITASPALAAVGHAQANAQATGVVLQRLTLTKVRDLDFGTVIGSTVSGSVTINADTGARAVTGGVFGVAYFPGTNGRFQGAGTSGQIVVLSLTTPTQLVSRTTLSNVLIITSMTVDNNNLLTRTIDASSAFAVGVGGVFSIAANQPNGAYDAQFGLTANYQ